MVKKFVYKKIALVSGEMGSQADTEAIFFLYTPLDKKRSFCGDIVSKFGGKNKRGGLRPPLWVR
jgi:hypothetical protein